MDQAAELRYYEILFIKTISQFYDHYKLDKLTTFLEMCSYISEVNTLQIQFAMQQVLTNDVRIKILRNEYIVCLKLFSGLNDTEIRRVAKCSPNTIKSALKSYEDSNLSVTPKFDLMQSNDIRKLMKSLRGIAQIF